jgi:uncharacterized caspase-like protein
MNLLNNRQLMHDALAGAVAFEAQQQSRGIPPLESAAAAAMLIGLILGEDADDASQAERALGHLTKVMRLIAIDCLMEKQKAAPRH